MDYKCNNNDYYHLVGRTLVDKTKKMRIIQGMKEDYDIIYKLTDGHAGNAYIIYLMEEGKNEMEAFRFRKFREVVKKYGELVPVSYSESMCVNNTSFYYIGEEKRVLSEYKTRIAKWAKIYPEKGKPFIGVPQYIKTITPDDL